MASSGFEVRVKGSAREVFDLVSDLRNLQQWDPGCAESRRLDATTFLVRDKHFATIVYRVGETMRGAGGGITHFVGRGRGFVTRESVEVRGNSHDCLVRYTVDVRLSFPYNLCGSCVASKLRVASEEAGASLQALFARRSVIL